LRVRGKERTRAGLSTYLVHLEHRWAYEVQGVLNKKSVDANPRYAPLLHIFVEERGVNKERRWSQLRAFGGCHEEIKVQREELHLKGGIAEVEEENGVGTIFVPESESAI